MLNPNQAPTPTQADIDRDGGAYDQALADDAQRTTRIQTDINRDGGLYDQALKEDAKRTGTLQREAYKSYAGNIKVTRRRESREARQELWEDTREGIGHVSKKVARAAGRAIMREVFPLATELMQTRNVHARMRQDYKRSHAKKPSGEVYAEEKKLFTGSIEDFKNIRSENKQTHRAERQQMRMDRANTAGYASWTEYQAAKKERQAKYRKNLGKLAVSTLPLWAQRH